MLVIGDGALKSININSALCLCYSSYLPSGGEIGESDCIVDRMNEAVIKFLNVGPDEPNSVEVNFLRHELLQIPNM